jgi:hypothetical protein
MTTSKSDKPKADAPAVAATPKTGRVQFDARGNAVWEWSVQTGLYDRNASTERVKILTSVDSTLKVETESPDARGVSPYESAKPHLLKPIGLEPANFTEDPGHDPYASPSGRRK